MTIQQVIDAILNYHPPLAERSEENPTCDFFKCGNPEDECRGIVTTVMASVEVIKKAIELGANLIIVHEPSFYTHMDPVDWLQGDPVYEEKRALLDRHGIAIYRDHDHIHTHVPDGIYTGVINELGWREYVTDIEGIRYGQGVRLPEPVTVRELALFIKEKMHLNGVRFVGNADALVQNVAIAGHMSGPQENATRRMMLPGVDVWIPAEVIDFTAMAYVRDAAQEGKNKAILNVGHFSLEELGMKWMVTWLRPMVDENIPITFVPSADLYDFII